jgi:hypothetical protein
MSEYTDIISDGGMDPRNRPGGYESKSQPPPIAGEPRRYYVPHLIPLEEGENVSRCNEQVVLARDYDTLRAQLAQARALIEAHEYTLATQRSQLADIKERAGKLAEIANRAAIWADQIWQRDAIRDEIAEVMRSTTPSPEGRKP